jgi:hypothetical protein
VSIVVLATIPNPPSDKVTPATTDAIMSTLSIVYVVVPSQPGLPPRQSQTQAAGGNHQSRRVLVNGFKPTTR